MTAYRWRHGAMVRAAESDARAGFLEKVRARGAAPHLRAFAESAYPDLTPSAALEAYLRDVERAARHVPSPLYDPLCSEEIE